MSRYGPEGAVLDRETESADLAELREVVQEFDILMNTCWDVKLSPEEAHTLNELYGTLNQMEQSYWAGVSDENFALLQSRLDVDFPMIRHMLGMLSPTPPED